MKELDHSKVWRASKLAGKSVFDMKDKNIVYYKDRLEELQNKVTNGTINEKELKAINKLGEWRQHEFSVMMGIR